MNSPTNVPTESHAAFQAAIDFKIHQAALVQQILGGAARGLYPSNVAIQAADTPEQVFEQLLTAARRV